MTLTSHAQKNANKRARLATEAVGTSTSHHEDPQREDHAPETDRSFPLEGSSISDNYDSPTIDPHSANPENKGDPRIDKDGSRTLGNTGYRSTSGGYSPDTDPISSSGNQGSLDRDTLEAGSGAVGSATSPTTGYGPESRQHEHQHHDQQYEGFGQPAKNTGGSLFSQPTTSSPSPFGTSQPAQSDSGTGNPSRGIFWP